MNFVDSYQLNEWFLTNDREKTDEIMGRYVSFLLDGYTLNNIPIAVDTILGYMRAVNEYYKKHRFNPPFDKKDETDAARLLVEQKKYEDKPDKREPLHDKVIIKMMEMAEGGDPYGFRRAIWLWTGLGRFGGFRRQEFAMEKKYEIQVYVKPDDTRVVRAFTLQNFIFFDEDERILRTKLAVKKREIAQQLGTEYDIQKNRMNGEIITFNREPVCPGLCPVILGLDIVEMAMELGSTNPEDPLCIFRTESGDVCYLTGDMITKYYCFVTKLVFPTISEAELKLISTHSLRVKAACLLQQAGKDSVYIKLRLQWLSDCFERYLRNTHTICAQHNAALRVGSEMILAAVALSRANLPQHAVYKAVTADTFVYELEDED